MSSKWSSDDEEKSNGGHQSPLTPNSPPSEQKQGGEKRPRRPRLGCGETSADDMKNEDTEKPASILKTITGGCVLVARMCTREIAARMYLKVVMRIESILEDLLQNQSTSVFSI